MLSLRDENAIEGIFVNLGEMRYCERVGGCYWEFLVAVFKQASAKKVRINLEIGPIQTPLNHDLPYAG